MRSILLGALLVRSRSILHHVQQFLLGVDIQLFVDVIDMCFGGAAADAELLFDESGFVSFCKQEKYFCFATT